MVGFIIWLFICSQNPFSCDTFLWVFPKLSFWESPLYSLSLPLTLSLPIPPSPSFPLCVCVCTRTCTVEDDILEKHSTTELCPSDLYYSLLQAMCFTADHLKPPVHLCFSLSRLLLLGGWPFTTELQLFLLATVAQEKLEHLLCLARL